MLRKIQNQKERKKEQKKRSKMFNLSYRMFVETETFLSKKDKNVSNRGEKSNKKENNKEMISQPFVKKIKKKMCEFILSVS